MSEVSSEQLKELREQLEREKAFAADPKWTDNERGVARQNVRQLTFRLAELERVAKARDRRLGDRAAREGDNLAPPMPVLPGTGQISAALQQTIVFAWGRLSEALIAREAHREQLAVDLMASGSNSTPHSDVQLSRNAIDVADAQIAVLSERCQKLYARYTAPDIEARIAEADELAAIGSQPLLGGEGALLAEELAEWLELWAQFVVLEERIKAKVTARNSAWGRAVAFAGQREGRIEVNPGSSILPVHFATAAKDAVARAGGNLAMLKDWLPG